MTPVDVCNDALLRLAAGPIASLTDNTPDAQACARHLQNATDYVLEQHDWGSATKMAELPLAVNKNRTEFAYIYGVPADLLRPIRLMSEEPFRLIGNRLYTNDATPVLRYVATAAVDGTADPGVDDPVAFGSLETTLAQLIALQLAYRLSPRYASSGQTTAMLMQEFDMKLSQATDRDGVTRQEPAAGVPLWTDR